MKRSLLGALAAAFFVLCGGWALAQEPMFLSPGADYPGNDLKTVKNTSLAACIAACTGEPQCKAFTFNTRAKWCFLKSAEAPLASIPEGIAGRIGAPTPAAGAGAASDLAFIAVDQKSASERFVTALRAMPPPENKDIESLKAELQGAIAAQDLQGASDLAKGVITLGADDYEDWRMLALALAAVQPQDPTYRAQLATDGLSAAIAAYKRSKEPTSRGEALGILGAALLRTRNFMPAIESFKLAASTFPAPSLQASADDAVRKYGFRVLDYTVDTEAAEPRICIKFSEVLKKGRVDYLPFVTVDGQAPKAVSARDAELCIEGVARGERHEIVVREGVPSDVAEPSREPAKLSIYVRDRSPTVRFTGQNYILPAKGRQGVPVVSVNASEVAADLYWIPERGLAGFVKGTQFLSQLTNYDAGQIAQDQGEKIWSGVLAVESRPNQEVTTSLPIGEALKDRKPGVYVLVAQPKDVKIDDWSSRATQWLVVSDIGVTSFSNRSGLHVFVRSLSNAKPAEGIEIALVARNNQVLGTAMSDAMGHAVFEGGLMRGDGGSAPGIVTVRSADGDYGFLDLGRPSFDLADRGVSGRDAPGPIDVFLFAERGIYRPGQTVHLTALARDDRARAIEGLPLTIVATRPDGVEYHRAVSNDSGLGGYNTGLVLAETAMRGTWQIAAYTDPKKDPLTTLRILVDDFVPDRIEFDLKSQAKTLKLDEPTEATVDARFLYGAPASGLSLEGELVLTPTRGLEAYPGYQFGMLEKDTPTGRTELSDLPETDENGNAVLAFQPGDIPQTTQPLSGLLSIRVVESGGRAVERQLRLPVDLSANAIGIKPLFEELSEGQPARFEAIAVAPGGKRVAMGSLKWELLKVNEDFQWYFANGGWTYESTDFTDRVASGEINVGADKPARIEAPTEWGRYRLVVETNDPLGPVSSVEFYSGWYFSKAQSDTPDVLQIALDKAAYKPGDVAKVKIVPRFAGTALITVVGEALIDMKAAEIGAGGSEVEFTVSEDWTPGTYVTATLYKPAGTGEDRMPARAVGVVHAPRDEAARTLQVALDAPAKITPRGTLTVPVSVGNIPAGESAYIAVAAVDVGVLNLTRYTPPDPDGWYFGKRKLAMELRDVYGQLIDGGLGAPGQIRSGGGDEADVAGLTMQGSPPLHEVVALYSGIVSAGSDGKTTVTFDIPEFNGTLRVMAAAWSKTALGDASSDVVVRDPVVVSESLPRILAPGDSTRLRLDIDNTDGPNGDYALSVVTSDGLNLSVPAKTVKLTKGKRVGLTLPLSAEAAGIATIDVKLTHKSGVAVEHRMALMVRAGQPPVSTRRIVSLKPGQALTVTDDMLAERVPGTASVTAALTRSGALDIPGILQALDRYPYGCTEQTTSRALPLLYLDEVAARSGLEGDTQVKARVQKAIYDVLANQSSEGAFGLWGPSSGDLWLDAFVTDFLTRAREKGFEVPEGPFEQAVANLQNIVGFTQNVEEKSADIAYALYVLARNKRASVGDLRFYAETKLDAFPSPMAKAQLGAALALYGDKERAAKALAAAFTALTGRKEEDWYRVDYGSNLRDGAALLALAAEADPSSALIPKLTAAVVTTQGKQRYTSTQEDAWMLMAARALLDSAEAPKIEVAGKSFEGDYVRKFTGADLDAAPARIVNRSDHPVDAVLTTTGVPASPDPAGGNGFSIERSYHTLTGEPADLTKIAQSDRIVVAIKVRQGNSWPSKILLTDLLPSGFEIDNPSLVSSASLANFDWLPQAPESAHLEFRDDRFAASLSRENGDNADVTFAYVVRAVTPGTFVHPPALVEDMYRPYLNARTASGTLSVAGPAQ
jgi:hypothetical protein